MSRFFIWAFPCPEVPANSFISTVTVTSPEPFAVVSFVDRASGQLCIPTHVSDLEYFVPGVEGLHFLAELGRAGSVTVNFPREADTLNVVTYSANRPDVRLVFSGGDL